jgi:hypothetical protein
MDLVDDGTFDTLDSDRLLIDAQNAGTFARSRAYTAHEFGEVVSEEQTIQSIFPLIGL